MIFVNTYSCKASSAAVHVGAHHQYMESFANKSIDREASLIANGLLQCISLKVLHLINIKYYFVCLCVFLFVFLLLFFIQVLQGSLLLCLMSLVWRLTGVHCLECTNNGKLQQCLEYFNAIQGGCGYGRKNLPYQKIMKLLGFLLEYFSKKMIRLVEYQ